MSDTLFQPPSLVNEASAVPAVPWKRWSLAFDVHNLISSASFTRAIWMIYLAAHGYNPLALGLFEMLFHVMKFVTEVPTGIFADMLGRRKSLMIFCVISAVESLLFLYPTTPVVLLCFALSGTAFAFRGGAGEALLWNIAGHADPEHHTQRYSRMVSRMFLAMMIGEMIGASVGGYLGSVLLTLPFLLSSLMALLSMVPLFFLPEQQIAASERTSALRHLGKGVRAVWQMPALVGLLLISGLTESCWTTIYFFYQLYLHDQGFSLGTIGLIIALSTAMNFLFTAAAPYVMRWLPARRVIPAFVGLQIIGLGMLASGQIWINLIGYLVVLQAATSILLPAISTYVNERSPEAQRATILSLQTGLFSAAMIVLFPLFGLGVTNIPYSVAYLWTMWALLGGSLVILALVLALTLSRKHSAQEGL